MPNDSWETEIDEAWGRKATKTGGSISGSVAAVDASQFLGVTKLSDSKHKTLQGLLDSSSLLNKKWKRDKNTILKR